MQTQRAFTLELIAAGPKTQVVAAGGRVALHEAREIERRLVEGPSSWRPARSPSSSALRPTASRR